MRRAFSPFFQFLFLLLACGCASSKLEPTHGAASGFSKSADAKISDVYSSIHFRSCVDQMFPQDDRFYLSYGEGSLVPLSEVHALSYPCLNVEVHFPPLRPNSTFFLYCPMTGCPVQPEVIMEFKTDEAGNAMESTIGDMLKLHNIQAQCPCFVGLYANPGYSSDWYILYSQPFSVLHSSFTYKPIVVSDSNGHQLSIRKKEPGGNVLEIALSGFPPKKELLLTSCSAGETMSSTLVTDTNGSSVTFMLPQAKGFSKGIDQFTISFDGGQLQAGCEWDMATLNIKRVQPPTELWDMCRSFAPKMRGDVAKR